ncbi:hypothetical protein [Haloarcula nitratireducens]|uniref:DUF8160 domain-containing protein n=1 Tax=Haloarcula nitratireducens TaxID=2487749 RepID=A0AAW4PIV8_9EURY|nr:hypothetical protein [Halomicroarcula nitratireducens]MBX0297924.1 hypothetical protein [Halomicroarcula nitratireducens]
MKDRDEAKDEMSERLGQRFESDKADKPDNRTKEVKQDKQANRDKDVKQNEQAKQTNQDNSAKNYKQAWDSKLIHLPDELMQPVDKEFDRMQYECDWQVKKERHYYPVVISEGISAVENMSGDEFTKTVENLSLR